MNSIEGRMNEEQSHVLPPCLPREVIIEFRAPSFAEKDHEGGQQVGMLGGSGHILAR